MKPEILLSNGKYYNFAEPDPAVIDIQMVAASLSKMCRFTGQVSRFYSVAEHCVRCSYIGPEDEARERLMHDAAESLVVDLPTPLKLQLPDYIAFDHKAEACIAERFGLRYPWPASVKVADLIMLATEKRDLLPPTDVPWAHLDGILPIDLNLARISGRPETWERAFLSRAMELGIQ